MDDDVDIREVLRDELLSEGYGVRVAVDGLDAIEKMRQAPQPDVILLDIGLPKLDGAEVLACMRALQIDIPVIVISAGSLEELRKQAPDKVREFIFAKPLNLLHLLEVIAGRIAERRAMPVSKR